VTLGSLNHDSQLIGAAKRLGAAVERLRFAPPVAHVYNPLNYAWKGHEFYLQRYGNSRKRVIFLGMNPGPFGMVQTGVPFGEIAAVRDWMQIETPIGKPPLEHPKRPVSGFACKRSEVSGRRLWGLFAERFPQPAEFFADHLVVNYCPLAFLNVSGANLTPDKLPASEKEELFSYCDEHLREVVRILQPDWLVAIGGFAEACAQRVFSGDLPAITTIIHPSPANPAANRNWSELAVTKLRSAGVWK
jgi:single-strand selective monofunctional uracil DNA glycosylase